VGGVKPSCFCVERERHFESKDIRNMSNKHGETTAKIAEGLQFEGYNVFSDHGTASEYVGKIVSTLEKDYSRKRNETRTFWIWQTRPKPVWERKTPGLER
jgi:hypothetical protein